MCQGNCSACINRTCETIPTCDESTKNWEHCEICSAPNESES